MKKILLLLALSGIFVSCEKNNGLLTKVENSEIPENESVVFNLHRYGSRIGLDEKLKITADSTYYSVKYRTLQGGESTSYQITIKTSAEQWDYLTKTFDLETFTKIQDGPCFACVDGVDVKFSVSEEDKIYSIYNGDRDEHYKQMQRFFDTILLQAEIFNLYLLSSSGCSSFAERSK